MRKPGSLFSRPGNRHPSSRSIFRRIATSALVLVLAGGFVVMAAGPANLDDAIRQQQARVAERPSDAGSLTDLGNLLVLAGDLTAAEEAYRQAVAIAPDLVSAHYNLALVLMQTDRQKEALKTLEAVLELDPQHAWSHYQMGTLMATQRNRNQAVRHYAEAFRLDRSLTSPKINPHIVENRFTNEALLTIYANESAAKQAPRLYEDPDHVTDLLLPTEPAVEAAPEAVDETPQPPRKVVSQGRSVSPRSSTPRSPAQLDGSMDAARDSQAAEPPAEPEDAVESGSTASEPRRLDPSSIRTFRSDSAEDESMTTGAPAAPAPSSETAAPAPEPSPSTGQPLGSSRTFIPGLQSTGRLEIELLPAETATPTVSPT